MDWAGVTSRVVVEACNATRQDVVLWCGDPRGAGTLEAGKLFLADDLSNAPTGLSILCWQHWLSRHPPADQRAAFQRAGAILPERGLLVVGDVMWSLPMEEIDEPEQFGAELKHVQRTSTLEGWAREAGFLPDLHRFGPGVAVLVALRGPR